MPTRNRVAVRNDKYATDGEEDGDKVEDPEDGRDAEMGGSREVVEREKVGPLRNASDESARGAGALNNSGMMGAHKGKDVVDCRDVCERRTVSFVVPRATSARSGT